MATWTGDRHVTTTMRRGYSTVAAVVVLVWMVGKAGAAQCAMHGEIGHTQFLPKSILNYGSGNLDSAPVALTSTANFLKGHGWRAGAGYQPGEANFAAIQAWNAAPVYQRAIALVGRQIDGGEGTSERR